jgi:anti-repressor protein
MKLVYIDNKRPITDSLIIAESFNKDHKHVLRDINELECSEEFRQSNFGLSSYTSPQNKELPKYLITQDGFSFLVMGYTGKEAARFKEMYINEFNSMKLQLSKPQLPSTFIEALEALLNSSKENLVLQQQAQINAPKIALYDTAMNAGNNFTMMHVAKTLGIGRNKLFDFLREKKVLMKNNLPYETYVSRGYFEVRQYTITHFTTGLENKTQTLVTPKGMAWIHSLLTTQQEAN